MAVLTSRMAIWFLVILAVCSAGPACGGEPLLDMGELSSAPVVADFLATYNGLMVERNLAGASSEALTILAKHPDNKDAQIAATYCWAFARMCGHDNDPPQERERAGRAATEALRRCLALIEASSPVERQHKYANLQEKLIPFELMSAACLAGSHTLVVRMAQDFFARDPDSYWCNPVCFELSQSFRQIRDEDGLTSCLKGLAKRYKGRWGASPVLWDLARIYDRRDDEAGFRSVLETMEGDFPDDNIYKQALRRLAIERAAGKPVIPPRKDTSTTGGSSQADPPAGCGCGCGGTTATATTVKPQPGAAATAKPAASIKATSGTVAGSCCTTACATTAAKKPQ